MNHKNVSFPYYKKFYDFSKDRFFQLSHNVKSEIINYIPKQMKYKNSIIKYNGNYLLIKEDWDKNEELNNMTDYFSENARVRCNFKNQTTPHKYWKKNHKLIEEKALQKYGNLDIKSIRDVMFESVKFCNNFRVSVAVKLFEIFRAKIILDPSAGWGDRLLAAIGHGADVYVGVDPNDDMHPCYQKMITSLVDIKKQQDFIMIKDGFETAIIPKYDYDLVFTSPPFFDLEEYSTSSKDSHNAHPTVDDWFNNFLLVLIKKSYENLTYGGHFVLYIAESTNTNYIDRMVKFTDTIMKSNGSFYYFYEGAYNPRRFFVWKKV